jgi:3-phosphoshikimate 1-carboxyvinyltransferase
MACSFLPKATELIVDDPHEQPWIDLTLYWLKKFGARVEHRDYQTYHIEGGLSVAPFDVTIPADFSSAIFPLAASLITGRKVELENLDFDDPQGDKELYRLLRQGFVGGEVDVNRFIDGVPILAAVACYGKEKTRLVNAYPARFKESDRLHAIQTELQKMGANIESTKDTLTIYPSRLYGANLFSHHDHRIAMALSVAALGARGPSTIDSISCISKSYPNFVQDMQTIGYDLKQTSSDSLWIPGLG